MGVGHSAKAATRRVTAAALMLLVAACMPERFGRPSLNAPPPGQMASNDRPLDDEPGGPGLSGPIESRPLEPPGGGQPLGQGPTQVANAPQVALSSRSAITGGWRAQEASGSSCRLTLGSTPSLDLYKASTSGCSNKDLQAINAWEYRDGEVFLYARGGGVVARLRGGEGSFSGSLAKSGAPLTLTR